MENENLIHLFYEVCELGNRSRCFESEDYKESFRKMESLLNQLKENASDNQITLIEELSDLCLNIINLAAPYDFENGFCTAIEFIRDIHGRDVYIKTFEELSRKNKKIHDG